jgi:hypothetical protein
MWHIAAKSEDFPSALLAKLRSRDGNFERHKSNAVMQASTSHPNDYSEVKYLVYLSSTSPTSRPQYEKRAIQGMKRNCLVLFNFHPVMMLL